MQPETQIKKRSAKHYSNVFKQKCLSRLKNEDITMAELCAELELPYNTLAYWASVKKKKKKSTRQRVLPLVPATVPLGKPVVGIAYTLPLQQEIKELKDTITILKKALAVCLKETP